MNSAMITTQIEIARTPDVVRKTLLDFSSYSQWHHNGLVKNITPLASTTSTESVDPLAVGQKLHCEMKDFTFDATITENSPSKFQRQGPPVMGIAGLHTFIFEPSAVNEGGTTFVQMEEYKQGLAFLMQPWLLGWPIKGQFEGFNGDLKRWVEG